MKMSSIFKKASVFAIAATMILLMVVSVLPAALADSSTDGLDFGEKLVSSNISIAGGITMKYYFELPEGDEILKPDCIKISYPNQGGSLTTTTYNIADLTKDGELYVVEVPVSFAQQTETITMQWFNGNEGSKKVFEKTVRNYADTVLKYANIDLGQYPQYAELKEGCQALLPTITNMLNAGALAQISCNYKATALANDGWFGIGTNPVDNMLASHFYDVEGADDRNDDYEAGNKDSGVTFTGTEIFLTSKVTLRVYIDCPDDVVTAKVYKGDESQTVAIKTDTTKDGAQRKFIVIKNIAPTAFNTRFRVEVTNGDKVAKFESSVLDYAYDTVNSTFASEERKDTAKALYLFYAYTKTYAGDSVVVDPAECNHARSYYFAKSQSIVCPDCGYTYPEETVKVLVTTKETTRIRQGDTGTLTLTYAIAGNTKFNALVIAPNFPTGISWTVDSVTYSDGFAGEAGRNVETDNLIPFNSAQFVTVTYNVEVGEDAELGVNQIGFSVGDAIVAEGEFNSENILATPVSIEVLPKLCETHGNVKYVIDGDYHYAYCKDCFDSNYVKHTYESGYKMANGKIVCYSKICACGTIQEDASIYTYDAGFELDENDNKINKAPLFLLTPADIAAKKFTDLGAVELSEEDGISFVTIHNNTEATEGSFYILDGNTKVTGRYLAIKYRTTTTSGSEFFAGANNKNAANEGDNTSSEGDNTSSAGENFYVAPGAVYVNNGEWHVMILDLAKIKPSSFIANEDGTYTADHIRWDIFNDAKETDQTVDIAYIAMSDDIMSVASFDGNDYYRVSTGVDKNITATPDYMASTNTLNVVADAEWIRYVPHSGGSTLNLESTNGGLKYAHITRKGTANDCYLYITNIANTGEISHYAHTTKNAKYFAVIYKTEDSNIGYEAFVRTKGGLDGNNKFVSGKIFKGDSEWHVKVVDMSKITADYYDPATGLATLRFDYWNNAEEAEGKWIADFAFFGVFNSEADAYKYCGDYLKAYSVEYTCTDHKWSSVTKEENGKLTVSTECANCGKANSSYDMPIGNKAPNLFIGAADIANKVANDSTNISKTYTLSDDGSYVTISNITSTGDGHINIFQNNTTVTGRYVVIKYRTGNYTTGSWQFYTTSNSDTPEAGKTGYDTFYLNQTTNLGGSSSNGYATRSQGGIVADGKWHYTVIDLAGVNADAFKSYDDGTYMAQYFRWDIFETSLSNSASIDVAYIAFADDIKNLTDMDNIVEYKYAYTRCIYNGTTYSEAAVIPMSTTTGVNNPFYDASHLAIKGTSGAYCSGTLKFDETTNNMPYAQFTAKSTADGYFDVWNCGYKISGSGKYVGVLYRASANSSNSFEFYISSTHSSAQTNCCRTTDNLTKDGEWRFIYLDVSEIKVSDKVYYKDSEGIWGLRFDVFNGGHATGSTMDIAFVAMFDGAADMAATLKTYNELYGLDLELGNSPTYVRLSNIGGTIKSVNYVSPFVNTTALTTSTNSDYLGQIYISGPVGIEGTSQKLVYRLLDANGDVLLSNGQEWRELSPYNNQTVKPQDRTGTGSYLASARELAPGVNHVYEYVGMADIRQFPGQTVTIECALVLDGVEGEDAYYTFMTFKNVTNTYLGVNIPTYVYISNIGGNKTIGAQSSAFVNNAALTTSTSAAYLGRIYITGRVAIEGSAQKLVYRLLGADGNEIQGWKELDYYSSNNYTFKDVTTGTAHLGNAQKVVPEVTNVYEYVGLANITAFPGQTVTLECALVLDGVEGEDAYYTFMTFTNVKNTQTP